MLLAAGLISVYCRQDDNWDLQNYHIYNAFSLLGGRLGIDLWSGNKQIYFNPLLDLPYYLVGRLWLGDHPRWVAFLAGLPFGLLAWLVTAINIVLVRAGALGRPLMMAAGATVIGLAGTTIVAEIGTTFGDMPIAVLILLGVLLPIAALQRGSGWRLACAGAGLALGAATGLKLTAGLYAPALGIAVVACGPPRQRVTGAALFAAAWCVACAPPVIWWGLHLQSVFGSPTFPLFNRIFQSPLTGFGEHADARFLPRSFLQWACYPFFLLRGKAFVVTEGPLRDPHFACAYLAILALIAQVRRSNIPPRREVVFLLTFFVCAFAVWEAAFSILRYAMPLEALTGSLIVLGIIAVCNPARSGKAPIIVMSAATVLIIALEAPANAGRLRHYGATVFDIHAPAVPDNAAVAFVSRPLSFVAPFLTGRNLVLVGIGGDGVTPAMAAALQARLRAASAVFTVTNHDGAAGTQALLTLGWRVDRARCVAISNPFQSGIELCPAAKAW